MDVHKESITVAVLPEGAKAPARLDRLANDLPKLKRYLERLSRDGDIRACYDASGAGYVLKTNLRDLCDLGGWKSIQTVLTCYVRPDEGAQREALTERLGASRVALS